MSARGWDIWVSGRVLSVVATASRNKILVGHSKAVAQRNPGRPPELLQLGNIQKLLRRSIRTRGVVIDFAVIANRPGNQMCELPNRHVGAGPDVEKPSVRIMFHN